MTIPREFLKREVIDSAIYKSPRFSIHPLKRVKVEMMKVHSIWEEECSGSSLTCHNLAVDRLQDSPVFHRHR